MEWWQTLWSVVTVVFFAFIAVVIILENRNPSKTVAWLIVITFIPIAGFLFYLIFGQNYRKKKRFRRKELADFGELRAVVAKRLAADDVGSAANDPGRQRLVNLIVHNSQSPVTMRNRVNVLTNGIEKFRALIQALNGATHHIHMQYYIWRADGVGRDIQRVLIEKARAGVEVRIIYDSVGSWRLDKQYIQELRAAGAEIYPFLPVVLPLAASKINYRNHRKIVVVDGEVAFMGGLNIGDEYLGKDPRLGFWRDTHLQVWGDAVYVLQAIFLMDWAFVKGETHHRLHRSIYFPVHDVQERQFMQIAASGPDSEWEAVMQAYFTAITSATRSVHITSPYFIPDDSILMAIKTAALSGIDVTLILPGRPDHRIVYWATMSYVEELLQAGVNVYVYQKGFIHAKILIIDGVIASLGTANMDIRSFYYNFEVNALIYDEKIVRTLEDDFHRDLRDSRRVTHGDIANRTFPQKLKESSARLFSPLL